MKAKTKNLNKYSQLWAMVGEEDQILYECSIQ